MSYASDLPTLRDVPHTDVGLAAAGYLTAYRGNTRASYDFDLRK